MADKIIAAVRLKRKVLEGTEMQVDIDTLLQSFSRKVLFARPGPETERLKRELVRAMRTIYLPEAVVSGRKSAIPILERIGSESVTAASRLTGDPLKFLSGFTQKNIAWFTQEVNTGTVALSSELKAELARATRDGVSKQRMITRVIDSYDAELRSLKRARKNFAEANKAVANAEATGDIKAIRAAKKVRSQARAATTRVTTAMGRLENKVQREATDAVRREAQRAQQAAYRQAGFTVFTWVAVNGSDACPDCEALHGETRSQQQWHGNMPGDGHTVCLDSCICELVPEEFTKGNKSIKGPVNPFLPTLPKTSVARATAAAGAPSATTRTASVAARAVTRKAAKKAPKAASKPKIPKFTPAKTVKEAEEWARGNVISGEPFEEIKFVNRTTGEIVRIEQKSNVRYRGLSVDAANEVNRAVFDLKNKMGVPLPRKIIAGNFRKQNFSAQMQGRTMRVNAAIGKTPEEWQAFHARNVEAMTSIRGPEGAELIKTIEKGIADGTRGERWTRRAKGKLAEVKNLRKYARTNVSDSLEGTIQHEIGHLVDSHGANKYGIEGGTWRANVREASIEMMQDDRRFNLSAYPETTRVYGAERAETFAESFTAFVRGERGDTLGPKTIKLFESLVQ